MQANKTYSNDPWLDAYEVGSFLCDLDEPDDEEIEQAIFDKYEISFEVFEQIIQDLLPLCETGISPINGDKFRGFAIVEKGLWLAKLKIENN